jgi:predicted ATPase/DNA-binding winged helix-turn-helix (wHTH) protein
MPTAPSWCFGPFRLDPAAPSLWRDDQLVALPPKPLAVLAYLVAHAGQVVTKDTLLAAVWPDTVVTEGVLKTALGQIRQVLGERAKTPHYIATVHRRGYRFIAAVSAAEPPPVLSGVPAPGTPMVARAPGLVVGREAELIFLQQRWTLAREGARQLVFITGEAGIGKTTLVDAFVAQFAASVGAWVGRGQCIEQYGAGEAYLPLLEALGRLGRQPTGAALVGVLRQQAPSWLVQLPALLPGEELDALQRRVRGTTPARMLRELAEAVEALAAGRPLVLVLEDLHWSDVSTIEWLACVARRREPARLLVLGTYRPVDAIVRAHPVHAVAQELQRHGQCAELVLRYLPEAEVATYLAQRFGGEVVPAGLADVLHRRTYGNPLFLVTMVDDLVRQGLVRAEGAGWTLPGGLEAVASALPESLRQLIEQQLQQLSPEHLGLLEAASLAGRAFSAAAVAAAVNRDTEDVEARLAVLAHQGVFIRSAGVVEWPDGTEAAAYSFLHELYREILSERVPPSRKRRWHLQIGARKEMGYGARAREIAAELAGHFVQGRDSRRAVRYLRYAGENALQRSAHQEAIAHFTQALTLLPRLPATAERTTQELQVQMALGPALMATKGFADPDVARTYRRARELCQQLGETPDLFPALWGLWQFANASAQIQTARELGTQLLTLARQSHDPVLLVQAHHALWSTELNAGALTAAYTHTEHGRRLYTPAQHRAHMVHYGVDDPGVCCGIVAAHSLWLLGYPDQAVQHGNAALALAQEFEHPFSLAYALSDIASLHRLRRDVPAAQAYSKAALALGTAYGFSYVVTWGSIIHGWALLMQGHTAAGMAQVRQGFAAWQAWGTAHLHPAPMVAEAYGKVGLMAEGLALLADALRQVEITGERKYEAELYRLTGELLWHSGDQPDEAEACLHHALTVARDQQAKAWELRAALSLSRLWQRQGRHKDARRLLAPIYGRFTEGFDTADLQEAKALLDQLS